MQYNNTKNFERKAASCERRCYVVEALTAEDRRNVDRLSCVFSCHYFASSELVTIISSEENEDEDEGGDEDEDEGEDEEEEMKRTRTRTRTTTTTTKSRIIMMMIFLCVFICSFLLSH